MFARKHFYVYTVASPDGNGVHVGKGRVKSRKSLRDRIEDHEVEARQGVQSPKCDIIRKIWAQGLEIQKPIVYETDSEEEVLRYEYALITLMSGNGNLTNYGTKGVLPTYKRVGRHVTSSPSRPFQPTALTELVDDVLSAKEVASILKVHPRTIARLTERGELPAFRADNLWRFRRFDVEGYSNSQLRSVQTPTTQNNPPL